MYYVLTKDRKLLDSLFSKRVFRKRSSKNLVSSFDEDTYWWDDYPTSRYYDDKTDFYLYTNYIPRSTQTYTTFTTSDTTESTQTDTTKPSNSSTQTLNQFSEQSTQTYEEDHIQDAVVSKYKPFFSMLFNSLLFNRYNII